VPESKAKKIGVGGEIKGEAKGKYPIPDLKHARNALARVSQHGAPAEREAVRKKVYAKYPGLREGFEERHGESPTAKENIKKVEQGGIGKTSGIMRPGQPTARELIHGRGPEARAARTALRNKMRAECPVGQEADRKLKLEKESCSSVKMAAFFDELEKIGGVDPFLFEMLKEAGLFEHLGKMTQRGVGRAGQAAKQGYQSAQVGTGRLMAGSFGHAGEHAAHKLMATASPTKALMIAAADPHAQRAVMRGVQKAGRHVSTKARGMLGRARHAVMPVSPVPAMVV
jgi:hypothetical protein